MLKYEITYCDFGDKRLDKRFMVIMNQLYSYVGGSLTSCGVVWSQIKAIYRFLSNFRVNSEKIKRSEQERMQEYMIKEQPKLVYHIQDTTTLNYSDKKGRYDLGCLNYIDHRGLFLHTSLLLDSSKVIQGQIEQDMYSREEAELGSSRYYQSVYQSLPLEVKESYRWVRHFETFQSLVSSVEGCRGISISDAESDFYELFLARTSKNADLIVRVHHNHLLEQPLAKGHKLLDSIKKQASKGDAWMEVLKADKHTKRPVHLQIRYQKITLALPEHLKWSSSIPKTAKNLRDKMEKEGHLTLYVVQAKEVDAPKDCEPIEWTVLTTIVVEDFWQALDVIQTYALRWQIEVFHLALKEGCEVEKLQLQTQHRLKNAIALYALIALHVTKAKYLVEICPDAPMTLTGFSKQNYLTLAAFLSVNYQKNLPKSENPTVKQFIDAIIIVGGGNPKYNGIRQLWKGFAKADVIFKTQLALKLE